MSPVKVLLHIKDENLRREAVDALRESAQQIAFEQHDSDWTSLLEHLGKIKPEADVYKRQGRSRLRHCASVGNHSRIALPFGGERLRE